MGSLVNSKVVFEGKRFSVSINKYLSSKGEYIREIVHAKNAVVVLALLANEDVLFVKQLREVIGVETLELPAGLVEINEDLAEAAKRELEEETGYRAGKIEQLATYYPSCGYSDETITIFVATELTKTNQNLDEDEQITEVLKIPFNDCLKMAMNNEFIHASQNIAIMKYFINKEGLSIK